LVEGYRMVTHLWMTSVSLIADVVGSRSVPRIQRRALQHRFTQVIDDFNLKYSKMIPRSS